MRLSRREKKDEEYRPQRMLLATWILELRLNEISKIKAQIDDTKPEGVDSQNE